MKLIPLTNSSLSAMVDDEDYRYLSETRWQFNNGRAYRWEKDHAVYMHREVLNAPKGKQVDHINHNKLDNRKSNLRLANQHQNSANTAVLARKKHGASSRFKGVTWQKDRRKWAAQIKVHYHEFPLGRFDDEVEAARAYDAAAKLHFGRFACVNGV